MDDLDTICSPNELAAKADFEHLRALVKIHITAAAPQLLHHVRLDREIVEEIEDAEAAEIALHEFPLPQSVDALDAHNRALRRAIETRTAYRLLREVLQKHCRGVCAPIN